MNPNYQHPGHLCSPPCSPLSITLTFSSSQRKEKKNRMASCFLSIAPRCYSSPLICFSALPHLCPFLTSVPSPFSVPIFFSFEKELSGSYPTCFSLSVPVCRKLLEVKVIDDEEYEKNKTFIIQLGEPVLLEIGRKHGQCRAKKEQPCVISVSCKWSVSHDQSLEKHTGCI